MADNSRVQGDGSAHGKEQGVNIKNYTSGISIETTVSRIEAKLAAVGAAGIMKLYGPDKKISALIFNMPVGDRSYAIRVPANVEACFEAMWCQYLKEHSRPREGTKDAIKDQASRTAWKLVQDWIEVQVSMIFMKQAEPLEVFLPYVWDGKQTYFGAIKGSGFKMLSERTDERTNRTADERA